jgi:2-polyprenyl-6-methoxyphenol hydroxylase-like FAD-dependent oxidoreductase
MAGLLAARVLVDHFDEVILLERDTFPAPGENRKGVPQGKHTHVLLEGGRQIMEKYFPGLTDELTQQGAVHIADASLNVRWFHSGGYHLPGASGIPGVGVSRPTLEALVRQRVLAWPNVRTMQDCNVSGLATTDGNIQGRGHLSGVRMIDRRTGSAEAILEASLVVDAGGRGSRSPTWLEDLGYARPQVEEIEIGIGYTTCFYRRKPEHLPGLEALIILAAPPAKRLGVLLAQDGDRWVVTLGGYLGEHAPGDHPGFLEFARSLPAPDIYNLVKEAELLREPVAYTFPANLRRHYEKLDRFPEGYLVIGDALCSFNPIYGQGMTVAAMEAAALGECLAGSRDRLARRFFFKASRIIDIPWNTAVGNDLSYPEIKGPRTPIVRFLNWYISKLHLAAHYDAQVSIAFLKVINMVASPTSILYPRIVWHVLKGNL